jgi:Ca-activated chloride channel family protein
VCLLLLLPGTAQAQTAAGLRGVVTDPGGRPLVGVRIGVIDQESATMREVQTDAAGRFQVDGLPADRKNRVVASKFGYQLVTMDDMVPGGDEIKITLRPETHRPLRLTPPASAEPEAEPVVELKSNLVLLNVSVKDEKGRPVSDLQRPNFAVYEDGARHDISHFQEESAPLSIVLLMDISDSMKGPELEEAKRAALEFVRLSAPDNEIALMAFNDQARLLQSFTRDRSQIVAAINDLAASGGTALYDAVAQAIELMPAARYARHVLVVFSDGKDESSSRRYSQVERVVQSSDIVMFAVGEYGKDERRVFMKNRKYYKQPALEVNLSPAWVLQQLADGSGGRAYFPQPSEPLAPFFALIAAELHHQYAVGFTPPPRMGGPKFRPIEVRMEGVPRPGALRVRARKGYWQ